MIVVCQIILDAVGLKCIRFHLVKGIVQRRRSFQLSGNRDFVKMNFDIAIAHYAKDRDGIGLPDPGIFVSSVKVAVIPAGFELKYPVEESAGKLCVF